MSAALLLLLACAPDPAVPEVESAEVVPLAAPRLLRRISLDLRGVLPTLAELDAVEQEPSRIEAIAASYLDDPRFTERMVSLLAERWLTVMDDYGVEPENYGLPATGGDAYAHAIGEEPLRLIATILEADRPWTDVVTADHTMANELLASIWPIDYPEGASGWQPARYTDGRPAAGVLSTNGFYWRYVTNESNKNRGRAAAIARLLLCTDLLGRPVEFQRGSNLDPEQALRTEPACVTCHATVDPIAASLFGYWWTIQYNPYEMERYHAERERLGEELLGTTPGWYGQPMGGLVDLGWYVARDPRYNRCAVTAFAEQLWRRPVGMEDYEVIEALRQDFEGQGLHPQALLLDLLRTDAYRAGEDRRTEPRERVERLLTPGQQRMIYADLAGLEWTQEGSRVLENDVLGVRTLGGGVDGYSVTQAQQLPGLTWVMVNQRAAQAAAQLMVHRDFGRSGANLLTVPTSARPGDEAFDGQLRSLFWRLMGQRAPQDWVQGIGALWSAVEAVDGDVQAWEAVVEAMFRDPAFVSY